MVTNCWCVKQTSGPRSWTTAARWRPAAQKRRTGSERAQSGTFTKSVWFFGPPCADLEAEALLLGPQLAHLGRRQDGAERDVPPR